MLTSWFLPLTHWGLNKMALHFPDNIFTWIFFKKICFSILNFTYDSVGNKLALVQPVAWRQTGNKLLITSTNGDLIAWYIDVSQSPSLNIMYFLLGCISVIYIYIDGILPKGPYPPCLRMADRALLAGYPRYMLYAKALVVCNLCSYSVMPW